VPVVAKAAPPGSHVGMGEPLSASKWEPHREMTDRSLLDRVSPPADHRVERPRVEGGQPSERSGAHGRGRSTFPRGVGVAHVAIGRCHDAHHRPTRRSFTASHIRGRSTVGGGVPGVSERGGDPPGPIPNPVVPTASAGEVLGGQLPGNCGPRARHPAPHRSPPSSPSSLLVVAGWSSGSSLGS
jgi:hypothetical protein